jgi:acyl-coenzyme A synthetase/AMP-(fatty) acid ligase
LIVQGRNFYGHDIAACIEEARGLRTGSVYVFSIDREGMEAVIVMMTLPKSEGEDDATDPRALRAEIQTLLIREFGLAVHDVRVVPRIPKTTSGKIVRHLCQQLYLDGT